MAVILLVRLIVKSKLRVRLILLQIDHNVLIILVLKVPHIVDTDYLNWILYNPITPLLR